MNYQIIEPKLQALGIEFRPEAKYYTSCPKCSSDRKKGVKSSLMVSLSENFVNYKCFHEGQCEWNSGGFFKTASTSEQLFCPPEPSNLFNNDTQYRYKDVQGNTLFIISRIDLQDGGKLIRPITYRAPGEWVAEGYKGKALYGAELLTPKPDCAIIVEGEKTCDVARTLPCLMRSGTVVLTWPGGAPGISRGDWDLLQGIKNIIIWPDNDKPGIEAAHKIVGILGRGRIVDTTGLPPKFDLADPIDELEVRKRLNVSKESEPVQTISKSITPDAFLKSLTTFRDGIRCEFSEDPRDDLRLPQSGLVIIAGRTGAGKTTLMVHLAKHILKTTDRKVIYYSYEIPASRMLIKMVMTLEGEMIGSDPSDNIKEYVNRIKHDVLDSWTYLKPLLNNRFILSDDPARIDQLVASLDSDANNNSVVFIDYIQLIGSGSSDSRYLVIKSFADRLRAVANKRNLIIVTGSQLTAGDSPYSDSVRESKDIENAAELVVKVFNKVSARATGTVKHTKDGDVDYYNEVNGNFVISTLKNRNGESGRHYGFDLLYGYKLVKPAIVDKFNEGNNEAIF